MTNSRWRRNKTGLFTGWWTDLNGKRIRRIRRNEYSELYRLITLGRNLGLHKEAPTDS